MKLNNDLLWCNGKQQNETMMCKSNYNVRLAGADDVAKVGAGNAYIILCKLDCKLKCPNMFEKTLLER